MKMRHYNWYYKNKKIRDYCEQRYANKLDNLEKNGKIPRNIQPVKSELGRDRKCEQTD